MFRSSIHWLGTFAWLYLVVIKSGSTCLFGNWSSWSHWSDCCGDCIGGQRHGTQSRERQCSSSLRVHSQLNQRHCTENCNVWSSWSSYSSCSLTCGTGKKTSTRQCTTGNDCIGENIHTEACYQEACVKIIDGHWGVWSSYAPCTSTCGQGQTYRQRDCNNPIPSGGGMDCFGERKQYTNCTLQPCPIDGQWGAWSYFAPCIATCGLGTTYRERQCDNPTPSNGGLVCNGDSKENKQCTPNLCPIDGQWGQWSSFVPCSVTCGLGLTYRERQCDSPAPSSGGLVCGGNPKEYKECTVKPCPIDGQWGDWSRFTKCSVTCGHGIKLRIRQCDNPSPVNGGKTCVGNSTNTQYCTMQSCPIEYGEWMSWNVWSDCSVTCASGIKTRTRTCNDTYSLKFCIGNATEVMECHKSPHCPVDGTWSSWGVWEACSVTCGSNGTQSRRRTCSNPAPSYGGMDCQGVNEESRLCQQGPCPIFPCYTCDGPVPQLCTHLMKPILCHEPYCINELTNSANGQKILNRRCGTKHECDRDWWYSTSDNEKCTRYDDTRTMYFDIQCSFCCTEAYCNKPTVPTYSSLYRPHGHYTLAGK